MATANPPPGALPVEHHGADPFVSNPHDPQRQRYAAFDNSQFSLYLNGSPKQAKRALQAHLAETTRRLQETSHLGNALVMQRKELEEKLQEVEQQQQDNDIGPELRQRLSELEKEFNEVGRETARTFLPKSRVPSGETDHTGSVSVYSTQGQHSPTKVSVPSRKQRNQQPSRINDVALATEISTSLLSQLKELQAVLLEKDDALKAADLDRSQLEIERDGLAQRLRVTDESESRLKDVNWNLETLVREHESQSKSAADREQRLNHALNLARAEKSNLERECEDIKQQFAKLSDDHINKTKQAETELSSLRRNVTMTESEKNALQRKVEDLANQNQELARAVAYRIKNDEQLSADDTSPDDGGEERDTQTPEHSPPPSPSKATPRHGILESETLKHSLQHAHRMIQQLKNNIHREKTEKIELKRMLQDARDELETNRGPLNGPGSASKRKKNDKDVFKKPARPDRLGALRSGSQEVLLDDDDWEEAEGVAGTPSRRPKTSESMRGSFSGGFSSAAESAAEGFKTADETSDAAFETANERDGTTTETDAFLTGAETLDGGSSDELTETEAGPSQGNLRHSRSKETARDSYESTASTSGDEFDDLDIKTPIHRQTSRFRLKTRDGSSRKSTPRGNLDFYVSSPAVGKDSPVSFVNNSRGGTPAQGKSLFAELNDLSGDEDEGSMVGDGTPSRSSVLYSPESSPDAARKLALGNSTLVVAKSVMVDSGTMTEPEPKKSASLSTIQAQDTTPQMPRPASLHMSSLSANDTVPQPPPHQSLHLSELLSRDTTPQLAPPPALYVSSVLGQATAPQQPALTPLVMSTLSASQTMPLAVPAPNHNFSTVSAQGTTPQSVPSVPLHMSQVSGHTTEPRHVTSPSLAMSNLTSHTTEPVHPEVAMAVPAALAASSVSAKSTEPTSASARDGHIVVDREDRTDEKTTVVPMQMSNVSGHSTEPSVAKRPVHEFSRMASHTTEPVLPARQPLQVSTVSSWSRQPMEPPQQPLKLSTLASQHTGPRELPKSTVPQFSPVVRQSSEPLEPHKPALSLSSTVCSQASEPIEVPRQVLSQSALLSAQATEPLQPREEVCQVSGISALHTAPVQRPVTPPSSHHFSTVTTLHDTQPESPTVPSFLLTPSRPSTANRVLPPLAFSMISMQETEPSVPSRPTTAHRTVPVPVPAFKAAPIGMADGGTQTMVSAEQIDKLLLARSQRNAGTIAAAGVEKSLSPPPSPSRRLSGEPGRTPRRPGSSGSIRSRAASPPPLPFNHQEVIAAAAKSLGPASPGMMGPPTMPASAYNKKPPQTPSIRTGSVVMSSTKTGGTTPRARRQSQRGDGRSGASSPISRRSSLSSFTSEVDQRFNMAGGPSFAPSGLPVGATDPRMIQAITQTMIGEYLWKYTRKTGREGLSENRHRRFFWIHPYTRTLYWSDRDPQTAGKTELKGKSVSIESVQEVEDNNPLPPGLHQKSLIVTTPGRSIKFTATTGQRHETWFNALSYLCQRVEEGEQQEQKPAASDEIQDEFNAGYRSTSRATGRSRASMASYVTRRTSSPHHAEIPTLRQSSATQIRSSSTEPGQGSTSSRFSILRPNSTMRGSFSSRYSRASAQEATTQEQPSSVTTDVNREIQDQVQRDLDNMVNVRACCDGKHDVGHLHMHSVKNRHSSATVSSRPSLIGSLSSRSQSRTESRTESRTSRVRHQDEMEAANYGAGC